MVEQLCSTYHSTIELINHRGNVSLVWMLQGRMSTRGCLSGGEWLMKPSSPESGMLPSKALSEYTEIIKNQSNCLFVVYFNRDITALLISLLLQIFCGGAELARQGDDSFCKKEMGKS